MTVQRLEAKLKPYKHVVVADSTPNRFYAFLLPPWDTLTPTLIITLFNPDTPIVDTIQAIEEWHKGHLSKVPVLIAPAPFDPSVSEMIQKSCIELVIMKGVEPDAL